MPADKRALAHPVFFSLQCATPPLLIFFRPTSSTKSLARNPGEIWWVASDICYFLTNFFFCSSRIAKFWSQSKHARWVCCWRNLNQSEEGMVLHTTLPQMLASLSWRGLKPVRTLIILNTRQVITKTLTIGRPKKYIFPQINYIICMGRVYTLESLKNFGDF